MDIHVTDMVQFGGCRLRWWFSSPHGLSLRPHLPPSPLFIGSIFHDAVEGWHLALKDNIEDPDAARAAGVSAMATGIKAVYDDPHFQKAAPHKSTTYVDDIALATGMFRNFTAWAYGRWEPVEVEYRLRANLRAPSGHPSHGNLLGRVDGIVNHRGGLWAFELKTAKTIAKIAPELEIDLQMKAYVFMLKRLGIDVKGMLRCTAFKTLPKKPQLVKDGTRLSRRSITTSYELLLEAIEDHGLSVADYSDWLHSLKDGRHPCFSLQYFQYSDAELGSAERMLYQVYRSIASTRKGGNIYSHPTRLCGWCAFLDACKALHKGYDYRTLLEEDFHVHHR